MGRAATPPFATKSRSRRRHRCHHPTSTSDSESVTHRGHCVRLSRCHPDPAILSPNRGNAPAPVLILDRGAGTRLARTAVDHCVIVRQNLERHAPGSGKKFGRRRRRRRCCVSRFLCAHPAGRCTSCSRLLFLGIGGAPPYGCVSPGSRTSRCWRRAPAWAALGTRAEVGHCGDRIASADRPTHPGLRSSLAPSGRYVIMRTCVACSAESIVGCDDRCR